MWHWFFHLITIIVIVIFSVDGLTLCWVRRVYEIAYRINYKTGGWIILLDVDGLKKINDEMGHTEGDRVLRGLGKIIVVASNGRGFRYGGDEFVVLTFSRNRKKGEMIVERIRRQSCDIVGVSYGIGRTQQEADANMYKNKSWE